MSGPRSRRGTGWPDAVGSRPDSDQQDAIADAVALTGARLAADDEGGDAILANCDQARVAGVMAEMLGTALTSIAGAFGRTRCTCSAGCAGRWCGTEATGNDAADRDEHAIGRL
jgi:hypothetical protein